MKCHSFKTILPIDEALCVNRFLQMNCPHSNVINWIKVNYLESDFYLLTYMRVFAFVVVFRYLLIRWIKPDK